MTQAKLATAILASILSGSTQSHLLAQQNVPDSNASAPSTLGKENTRQVSTSTQMESTHYTLRNQDVLVVSFPGTPEFDQTVVVQPDGYINLTAGPVYVLDKTLSEVTASIRQAYLGILKDGFYFGVDLRDSQKPLFTVLGQVAKPGQYVLRADITVSEALSVAGGLNPSAKTQLLFYHKESDAWFRVEKFDLKSILHGHSLKQDVLVHPGDMIFVPEKFIANFKKYVPYSLNAATYSSQSVY